MYRLRPFCLRVNINPFNSMTAGNIKRKKTLNRFVWTLTFFDWKEECFPTFFISYPSLVILVLGDTPNKEIKLLFYTMYNLSTPLGALNDTLVCRGTPIENHWSRGQCWCLVMTSQLKYKDQILTGEWVTKKSHCLMGFVHLFSLISNLIKWSLKFRMEIC